MALPEDVPETYSTFTTFNVRIDTLYINKSTQFDWIGNAGLSFDLKCESELIRSLICYIDQSSIDYSPSTDPMYRYSKKNNFTTSSLNYSQIYFKIVFNTKGTVQYIFESKNIEDNSTLLEMYRMIGDQLSIGDDIKTRNPKFSRTEKSVFGTCPTLYFVSQNRHFTTKNYTLRSLIAGDMFKLKKNRTLEITKYRYLKNCDYLNNYILGKKLWTDLFPASNDTAIMVRIDTY